MRSSGGKRTDFPADALEGIDDFLESLDGSAHLAIADQYMFGQKRHTHFGGNLSDSSAPPVQGVPIENIVDEVYKGSDSEWNAGGFRCCLCDLRVELHQ
jgi:hypothetical protein